MLREDVLPMTGRKVMRNLMIFKTIQRCQGLNDGPKLRELVDNDPTEFTAANS